MQPQPKAGSPAVEVSIVIPFFNEEDGVERLMERLRALLANQNPQWQLVLVNDGSLDDTRDRLLTRLRGFANWKYIQLSRNFGQQAAYRAGIDASDGNAVVLLDADLQDPPELIPEMVERWKRGAKLITACRKSRAEKGLRRLFFEAFHFLFHRITGGVMPKDSGTFGLMDRVVADQLRRMPELNVFFPALRSWVGFRQEIVWYDREAREGAPKQSIRRLFSYAWNGITSFSTVPLRLISVLGLLVSIVGFGYAGVLIVIRFMQTFGYFPGLVVQGFTTLASATLCLGGIQLLCLGIMGEYLTKIYTEVKRRPPYVVEEVLESPRTDES